MNPCRCPADDGHGPMAQAESAGIAYRSRSATPGGHLMLLERMDGGPIHTVHSATTSGVCRIQPAPTGRAARKGRRSTRRTRSAWPGSGARAMDGDGRWDIPS